MSLKAELLVKLSATQKGSNDFGGPSFNPLVEYLSQLADGVDAHEADLLFVDERTVNASTNDDIDLAGVLASAFGSTVTFAEIVGILIINKPKNPEEAANLSNLTVGNEGTNPYAGFVSSGGTVGPLPPGAMMLLFNPGAAGLGTVTAGTGDKLRIANGSGGAAKYQIAILGRSAAS